MPLNLKDPKVKLAAGGAVAVAALAYYRSHSGAAASSTTTADPAGASSALGDANLQSAVYDSLEQQYQGLNAQLSSLAHSVRVVQNQQNHEPKPKKKAASPKPPAHPKPPPSKKVPVVHAARKVGSPPWVPRNVTPPTPPSSKLKAIPTNGAITWGA